MVPHRGNCGIYIQQKTWGLSIVGTIFEIYMKFGMSVRHSVGAIKQPSDITKNMCVWSSEDMSKLQIHSSYQHVCNRGDIHRTYTCSVDAKHRELSKWVCLTYS